MVSLDVASNCNFNPKGLSGWVAMINLRSAAERYTCELKGRRSPTFVPRNDLTTRDNETTSPRMMFQLSSERIVGNSDVGCRVLTACPERSRKDSDFRRWDLSPKGQKLSSSLDGGFPKNEIRSFAPALGSSRANLISLSADRLSRRGLPHTA